MNFSIADLMSDASKRAGGKVPKYELKRLPIDALYPDPENKKIYRIENIEELADSIIVAGGVLHNLVVREADEGDKYRIISGERRWTACKMLRDRGEMKYSEVNCLVEHEHDEELLQLMLIQTNSTTRQLSDAEKVRQAERITAILTRMKEEGRLQGKVRDAASKILKTTTGQLGRYHAIQRNLKNKELLKKFESGEIGVSVAYESSRLDEAGQAAVAEKAKEAPVTLKDVTVAKMQHGNSEKYKAAMERMKAHRELEAQRKAENRQEQAEAKEPAPSEVEEKHDIKTEIEREGKLYALNHLFSDIDELLKKEWTDESEAPFIEQMKKAYDVDMKPGPVAQEMYKSEVAAILHDVMMKLRDVEK